MLVGARDEGTGVAKVFGAVEECDVRLFSGVWVGKESGIKLFSHEDAEPFCQNIPPGEKRVIDLEKSVIVHVAPKKTAVEELVEEREKLREYMKHRSQCEADREIFSALSRVRQEQQERGE